METGLLVTWMLSALWGPLPVWGQAWPPTRTLTHGSGPQSAACMRTFLDTGCGLTPPAETAQEHEGLPQGAGGHGDSGRVSGLPGVTQQGQA